MGRTVVVTGTTRGLGRALARGFVAAGHVVAGCGRDAAAVALLNDESGGAGAIAVVDVTDDAAVGAWAEGVLSRMGPPDLLVNNAALMNRTAPLWDVPPEEFRALLAVNLAGIHHVTRHFLPAMIGAGRGVVVNVSSGWGRGVDAEVAPYCATKWGVEGLTQALALELPRGLAAVPLNPGVIDTDMLRSCWGESASAWPSPEEWAVRAVPYLLSLGPKDNGRPRTVP